MSSIAGEVVTETFDDDGGRQVTVYIPSDQAEAVEYSPGFDPERFSAHEEFFVEDVRRWARSRFDVALPTERTAVFGVSASGELALAIGIRHPDIYGAIFCASPGAGYRPQAMKHGVTRASSGWV